jgi:glycosyltransferase involved in cell wall biosynthesis
VLAALSCGAIVIATEPLTIPLLHRAVAMNLPGQRSLDIIPTPPGGVLVPLSLLVATVLTHCTVSASFRLATSGFSAMGLAEDLRGRPIRARLGLEGAASGRASSCRRLRRPGSALRRVLDWACGTVRTTSPVADDDCGVGRAGERRLSRTASSAPRITVFTRSYPPAHLRGGPARSVFALVEALAADFRFSLITSAFDDPAAGLMRSVKPSQWSTFAHAMIWYERRYRISAWRTATLLKDTKPQLVYLNSFFDYRFTILPLFITRMTSRKTPVVLAPRGEFSVGALALKWQKKRAFITVFRMLGMHKTVSWHASTSQEKADIERVFGASARSYVAIDLRTGLSISVEGQNHDQQPGVDLNYCSLVFFSRIAPKKNVATAIRAMPFVRGKARLSIAGPIEDAKYWGECLDLINNIGDPEMIKYVGSIPADGAINFLSRFDLFVFPTLGENFGHVVLESLAAGTPVIVGNDTPWHQIETAGAGWICDPASPEGIAELIERFLTLDGDARMRMSTAARNLARQVLNDPRGVDANRAMFHALTFSRSS